MSRHSAVQALIGLAVYSTLLACSSDPSGYCVPGTEGCSSGGDHSTVIVAGQGTGSGRVVNSLLPFPPSNPPSDDLGIDCDVGASNPTHTTCQDDFVPVVRSDPADQYVQLEAITNPGSVFAGWFSGCSDIVNLGTGTGNGCIIQYSGLAGPVTYTVTARFNLAGATNTVMFYNSSSVSAYLVGPGEAPGNPGTLVESHGPARDVTIPTTVGSQATFRAYLSPGAAAAAVATITCLVTASAWQTGTHPLVAFNNSEGNFLTCSDGLVAP